MPSKHSLSSSDSKLEEEMQALRQTFSNFTEDIEGKVKGLNNQGKEVDTEGLWKQRNAWTLNTSLP